MITLGEHEDRILTIVKGKYGLKNKNEAVNFVISKFEQELLEPEFKPEFVERIKRADKKGKFTSFKDVNELRKHLEHA